MIALAKKAAAALFKLWPYILAALLLVSCLVALSRCQAEDRAVESVRTKGAAVTYQAGESASQAAAGAVADLGEREAGRVAQDQESRYEILAVPDARADAGAAGRVGFKRLCKRPSYRDHPDCVGLRQPDPAPDPR